MSDNNEKYNVTVYYMNGTTKVHKRVSNETALQLEKIALIDKKVARVTSMQV